MNDGEFLSDLKHDREEEYFRRREQELIEKLRREAATCIRRGDQVPRPGAPEVVKQAEPQVRPPTSWGRLMTVTAAIASLVGVVVVWIWMTA